MVRSRAVRIPGGGFLGGIIIGALLTYCLLHMESSYLPDSYKNLPSENVELQRKLQLRIAKEEGLDASEEVTWPVHKVRKKEDNDIALTLMRRVRILCCVLTSPNSMENNVVHIKATWGRRCSTLLFMSSKPSEPVANNLSQPIIELNVTEGHKNSWARTKAALMYIYKHHLRDAEWIFMVDDTTYAVVENLRYLLKDQNANTPVYLGRRFKGYAKQGYMSGGAGYVLSREAVRRLATVLIHNPVFCLDPEGAAEDTVLGACLEKCEVKAIDTRDDVGRQRFHPLGPWDHLMNGQHREDFWLFGYDYYPTEMGPECCSDYTITFHHIPHQLMYILDFILYQMKPYGIAKNCDMLEDN